MSIILIRHGETLLNAARVIQPADTPLSPRGRAQAEVCARRVAGLGLAGLVSSDLPRAIETAGPIASATGLAIRQDELLRERNFGTWRGQAYDTLGFDPAATDALPPQGESVDVFALRVARAFAAIARLRASLDGPVGVVTHGLVIRAIVRHHAAVPAGMAMPEHLANTALTILDPDPPHRVQLLFCASHLAGPAGDDGKGLSGF